MRSVSLFCPDLLPGANVQTVPRCFASHEKQACCRCKLRLQQAPKTMIFLNPFCTIPNNRVCSKIGKELRSLVDSRGKKEEDTFSCCLILEENFEPSSDPETKQNKTKKGATCVAGSKSPSRTVMPLLARQRARQSTSERTKPIVTPWLFSDLARERNPFWRLTLFSGKPTEPQGTKGAAEQLDCEELPQWFVEP